MACICAATNFRPYIFKTNLHLTQTLRLKHSYKRPKDPKQLVIDVDHILAPEKREPFLIKTFGETLPKATPFPYEKKKYGILAKLFDRTMWRMNRNSKVVLVEGNIASGKTEVAKRIAHDFDMQYFPSPKCDEMFILKDGFDLRSLNHMLSRRIRHYDYEMFYSDPEPEKGMPGLMQFHMYRQRLFQYARAMLHLLSTGQGVVIERSAHADIIFAHVLHQFGFLSDAGLDYYVDFYKRPLVEFLPPHLTVYLDAPVHQCRAAINERNIPWEVNSKVLTDEYLEAYGHFAKSVFLPIVEQQGESLIVDTTDGINLEDIVEDVGNLDLETKDHDHFTKFDLWGFISEHELSFFRHIAQDRHYQEKLVFIKHMYDAPELAFTTDESVEYKHKVLQHPRMKYARTYEAGYEPSWKIALHF